MILVSKFAINLSEAVKSTKNRQDTNRKCKKGTGQGKGQKGTESKQEHEGLREL